MSSKRALVVDDSKSARAFLSRILERHEITVDAAESAEAAIDYLTRNRPDVIFMDHMMPGMDGFQAVQSIKNNPRTAAIPILMYTSQEGDLYLGQARALGAEGVLPKQIKQADVTKMLFQLQLVSDRRTREQSLFTAADQAPDLVPANESEIVVQPAAAGPGRPDAASGQRGPAIRAAAAEDDARNPRRARPVAAEGNRRAARLHRHHARFPCRTPARRSRDAAAGDAHARSRSAHRHARAAAVGRHLRLVAGRHRRGRRRVHELAVVEPGRRNGRAAHRSHRRLCRARSAARQARGS